MADDPPPAGQTPADQRSGWPHRPAELDGPPPGSIDGRPPWAQPPPSEEHRPAPLLRNAGEPPPPPGRDRRRRLVLVAVTVAVLLGVLASIGLVLSLRGTSQGGGTTPESRGVEPTTVANLPLAPGTSQSPPSQPGVELTLLAGRVVVAARPGWQGLESGEDSASVRLVLKEPTGRGLLTTLTIATLSSPDSFDSTLKLDHGTSFEVKGVDGPLRVTVQPGSIARIVAGADRPKAAFFLNVSIFSADGQDIDVSTLRSLFTDQVAPALRFP